MRLFDSDVQGCTSAAGTGTMSKDGQVSRNDSRDGGGRLCREQTIEDRDAESDSAGAAGPGHQYISDELRGTSSEEKRFVPYSFLSFPSTSYLVPRS